LRGAQRRSNPELRVVSLDGFASLAMTISMIRLEPDLIMLWSRTQKIDKKARESVR
jgi:hypothetical protein